MGKMSTVGRVFYGAAIAGIGFQAIYYGDFPYMLIPPKHSWIPGLVFIACASGVMLVLAGACIVFAKVIRRVTVLLGTVLLLIFCFYYIPYEFISTSNYMHFGQWENAAKELALAGGAFVIAGCFPEKNENALFSFLEKPVPFGALLYSMTIISFSIDHFLYAKDATGYVPSWVPYHLFCIYFTGLALLGSGIAIALKIKPGLFAALLGSMIFIWFMILHIPKVVAASFAERAGETTSAFLAFAYSGTAFVIAGAAKKRKKPVPNSHPV